MMRGPTIRNWEESPMRRLRQALLLIIATLALLAMHAGAAQAQKKTLVVALNQDPDILDPTLARTYVGRIVFSHICEKLYEIDDGLRISPQLAAALPPPGRRRTARRASTRSTRSSSRPTRS